MIFASLWEANRTPWSMSSGGPAAACSSPPTAATRGPRSPRTGLPRLWGKVGVSVSGADGNRVYAIIENEAAGGLYVSDDAGASWKLMNDNRNMRQRAFYYTRLNADPGQRHRLRPQRAVLQVDRRRQDHDDHSRAARRQSRPVDFEHRQQADGAVERRQRQRDVERRQTWTEQDIPTGQFYNVFTTKHVPYHICGAQQDNSTACVGSQANPARARAACRRSSMPSAAARAATSRRIRKTSTSSSPAATAAT